MPKTWRILLVPVLREVSRSTGASGWTGGGRRGRRRVRRREPGKEALPTGAGPSELRRSQTRIWLRGETNADGIASGDGKPEGPGWFGFEPCTTAPAYGLELRPLAASPAW